MKSTLGHVCHCVNGEHLRCFTLKSKLGKIDGCISGITYVNESEEGSPFIGVHRSKPVSFENQWGIHHRVGETTVKFIQCMGMQQV